jgi:putative drug exporter of the RND superfamily
LKASARASHGQLTLVAQTPEGTDAIAAAGGIGARLAESRPTAASPSSTVMPSSGPSSVATTDLVRTIRDRHAAIAAGTHAELAVTGQTAVN